VISSVYIVNVIYNSVHIEPGIIQRGFTMQEHTFEYNGHTLNYTTAGSPDKPPLMMIHGYTLSRHVWRTTVPALQDDMYCVAIDLLGHGDSPIDPKGDYSIEAQGHRVLALADELGLEHFSLIGHSMGGQIALCIASMLAPQRVEKLVDVSGVVAAKLTKAVERDSFRPIKLLYGTPFGYAAEVYQRSTAIKFKWAAKSQFGTWFHDFDCVDFGWWRIDRELANRPGARHTWFHGMNAIEGLDLTTHLPNIKTPTLAIFGAQDNVVLLSDAHLVDEHVPDSKLVLIDECGHFPMYEKQERYIVAIREFLV
jgi:pimeloyl-ACP methyl ester carboxylesterase